MNKTFKRTLTFLLIGALTTYAFASQAAIQQDRKNGKTEQTQKKEEPKKTVKEVPKSRKQDRPEPVRQNKK